MAAPRIIACLEPTPPIMECKHTPIFGVKRGMQGRFVPGNPTETIVLGVAVHCIRDSYDGYLAKACVGNTRMPVGCHASFHYVMDAETGAISSLVSESDVAWSFQSYRGNFPPTTPLNCCQCPTPCPQQPCPSALDCVPETYPGWTVLSGIYPNLSADFYTINIGITQTTRPEQQALDGVNCCIGPYGLSETAYKNLVQLLAWIEFRYDGITLDAQHIAFHDDITPVTDEQCLECNCGPNGSCLICDVSAYCERCTNVADPTISITETNLAFVYGENSSGCRVKIAVEDLKALLELLP